MSRLNALRTGFLLLSFAIGIPALVFAPLAEAAKKDRPPRGGGGGTQTCTTTYSVIDTYNGRATGIDIDVNLLNAIKVGGIVADTGPLGPVQSETQSEAHLAAVNLNLAGATAKLGILDNLAKSMGNTSTAWSSVVGTEIAVNGLVSISAGVLQATARAIRDPAFSCSSSGGTAGTRYEATSTLADVEVAFNIAGLSVGKVVIRGNAAPNTQIKVTGKLILVGGLLGKTVDVATIYVNEQYLSNNRQVVNALRIKLNSKLSLLGLSLDPALASNITIAHAEAGIAATCGNPVTDCSGDPPSPPVCRVKDFVTGGGWIDLGNGGKGTFGFNGGYRPNGLSGHLSYRDHRTSPPGMTNGAAVSSYSGSGTTRAVAYDCSRGDCVLTVSDNGEPGDSDRFGLTSSDGTVFVAPMPLGGGNIQLHRSGCPTAP